MTIKIIEIDPAINRIIGHAHEVRVYWCTYTLDEICGHCFFVPYNNNTDILNKSFPVETSFSKIKEFRIDISASPPEIREADRKGNYHVDGALIDRIIKDENGDNILIDVSVRGYFFSLAHEEIGSSIGKCMEHGKVSFDIEELFLWDQGF